MSADEQTHEPRVIPRSEHLVSRKDISESALKVMRRLREHGYLAYMAGGAVRDLLTGRKPKDIDVVTDARPEEIRRIFRNSRLVGRRFRIAHILFRGEFIEVATFRSQTVPGTEEERPAGGRAHTNEDGVVIRDNIYGTPEEDARRRDFTVNALFYNSDDFTLIDYVGGLQDLRDRILRCLGDPDARYTEDPVRMIRALRFAAILDFRIEENAYEAIRRKRDMLAMASSARMFDEIQKLFLCGRAERVFDLLLDTGLFDVMFPELGAWIRGCGDPEDWVRRVMKQLDIWRGAGVPVHPELMLALIFGYYHEHLAGASGAVAPDPGRLATVTAEHMLRLGDRISIPRAIIRHVGDIMAVQPRFREFPARKLERFRRRPCFTDAFIYFKLRAKARQCDLDALAWWEEKGLG